MALSPEARGLLQQIDSRPRFPIVRYELRSTRDRSLISTALNHVYLTHEEDSMDEVKRRAQLLKELEDQGLITLDYKIFITVKSDYTLYYRSDIFGALFDAVLEGMHRPGYLFDTPYVKRGMAALTKNGKKALEEPPL